jgi:tRNA modification GTPase
VNAGKSSLLNLLSKREAAIVSEQEGTTRDIIETYLNIDGYPVILADTAGIREVKNKVEKEGIQRAIKKAKNADLILVMIDNSLKQIDKDLKKLINENCILVFNKSDLNKKIPKNAFIKNDQILISTKDNHNIDKLVKTIKDKLSKKFTNANNILVTRERHRSKLNDALKEIEKFLKKDQQKEIETAAEDLRLATRHLGSIVGKVDVEEILGSIFQDFCIGK